MSPEKRSRANVKRGGGMFGGVESASESQKACQEMVLRICNKLNPLGRKVDEKNARFDSEPSDKGNKFFHVERELIDFETGNRITAKLECTTFDYEEGVEFTIESEDEGFEIPKEWKLGRPNKVVYQLCPDLSDCRVELYSYDRPGYESYEPIDSKKLERERFVYLLGELHEKLGFFEALFLSPGGELSDEA